MKRLTGGRSVTRVPHTLLLSRLDQSLPTLQSAFKLNVDSIIIRLDEASIVMDALAATARFILVRTGRISLLAKQIFIHRLCSHPR